MNIFISYLTCNKSYVEELKTHLEKDIRIQNVFIAPREKSFSILNSEKITKLIDISQVFISIMSTKAIIQEHNNWLHQELGYAYNHMKNGYLKIIIISDERKRVKGFIDSTSHDLSIKMDDSAVTSDGIISVIFGGVGMNSNIYPVKIRFMPIQFKIPRSGGEQHFSTVIDNESFRDLDNMSITIITPEGSSLNIMADNPLLERFESNNKRRVITMNSKTIPINLLQKIDNKGSNTLLSTIYLKTIHSFNTYDIKWKLNPSSFVRDHKFPYHFGLITKLPIFGVYYYQGQVNKVSTDELMLRIDPLEKEKIIIQ